MPESKRTTSGVLGGLAGLVGLSAVAGVLISATVTPAIAVTGAAASSAITMFDNLPSVLDIDQLMLPTTIYANNPDTGQPEMLTQFYDQNRIPVEYDEIAPVMYDAILSSEDPRYYQHGGVDLIGTTRAVLSNLRGGGEVQGGSSISQQYVKNILVQKCESEADTDEAKLECWDAATTASGTEGIQRKLQEMRYAIALEQKYTKEEILLGYLNIANFGGTTYGIEAAAQRYFGVTAGQLTVSQAATLAGIVQNPNSYRIDKPNGSMFSSDGTVGYNKAADGIIDDINEGQLAALDTQLADGTITQEQYVAAADPYSATKGRQLYVLSRLLDDEKINQEQYVAAVIEPITPNVTTPKNGCSQAVGAEYFCQYVRYVIERDPAFGADEAERKENLRRGGLNVYTTLDWRLQNEAQSTITEVAPVAVEGGTFGAAGVSIEAATGRILTIAQNSIFDESSTDGATGRTAIVYAGDKTFGQSEGFNAGSTFKLFTLVDWLEKGHSVREVINGRDTVIKTYPDTCYNGGAYVNADNWKPGNFGKTAGYVGTPMQFTRDSLNSGYTAMAAELDLCDIGKVATKMGVMNGITGEAIEMKYPNQIIGSDPVSPIAMAGAYATVANNGIYCQPQAIDRVTDADGNDRADMVPARTCTPVLDPKVAATAAYALQGVMTSGGTGSQGNPYDGTQLIGKTGTHQELNTWLVESSTTVATAVWVGNANGKIDMFKNRNARGTQLSNLRYAIAKDMQRAADTFYPAGTFPAPDAELSKQVLTDLPNVVGMPLADAQKKLEEAGFEVIVGPAVDSPEAQGIVATQDPPAGKVAGGTPITISPSTGQGVTIPDVSGRQLDRAINELRAAGFGNVAEGICTEEDSGGSGGGVIGGSNRTQVTGTDPAAGSVVNRNTAISVNYTARDCDS